MDDNSSIFYDFYVKVLKLATPIGIAENKCNYKFSKKMAKYIIAKILKSNTIADEIIKDSSFNNFSDDNIDDLDGDIRNNAHRKLCKKRIRELLDGSNGVMSSLKGVVNSTQINEMTHFINGDSKNYHDLINDITNYVEKQWRQYKQHKIIKHLRHTRVWMIIFAVIVPCIVMTIANSVFQYVNTGIMYTALAFYTHFFNIDIIDRIIVMLICDCPMFMYIHKINTKLEHLLK